MNKILKNFMKLDKKFVMENLIFIRLDALYVINKTILNLNVKWFISYQINTLYLKSISIKITKINNVKNFQEFISIFPLKNLCLLIIKITLTFYFRNIIYLHLKT